MHVLKLCRSSERHRQRPQANTRSALVPAPPVSSVLDQRHSQATLVQVKNTAYFNKRDCKTQNITAGAMKHLLGLTEGLFCQGQ